MNDPKADPNAKCPNGDTLTQITQWKELADEQHRRAQKRFAEAQAVADSFKREADMAWSNLTNLNCRESIWWHWWVGRRVARRRK